ncbi:MAG: hypothetical protein K9J12_17100 [Melioribacteraceae bacterium]|nr:hypothetical protein [Melioribacteraceae bacterium]MCF8265163.1 hypothetical protein [Melioribacteraceae bacterium]MCF8413237.1 hypothetical protein [Melioribacteraceae bacterium]
MKTLTIFVLMAIFTGCGMNDKSVENFKIHDNWEFQKANSGDWNPTNIPSQVHEDLMRNNKIDDPFFGLNEKKQQWIGKTDWEYKTRFDVPKKILDRTNVLLKFEGLDTYADVFLNGELILQANNMFRVWEIDCKNLLKPSDNELKILFKNIFDETIPKWENADYPLMAYANNDQADTMIVMYTRKAQFHNGWDWGPRLITAGIWKPVYIKAWDSFKIDDVQIIQENVNEQRAEINSIVELESDSKQEIELCLLIDGKETNCGKHLLEEGKNFIKVKTSIENPNLWWSNGLGGQYLYNFEFKAKNADGLVDIKKENIGIRSLKVVREGDQFGTSFFVELNGVPVFMKGANYIPQDNFENRVSREDIEFIVKSAAEANMNMLRVWGGGIYPGDDFYELCDQYGILVWQDFMFACAMYPYDEGFLENVKAEISDNVKRIRNHASVALYCGNNENWISWKGWGWSEKYDEDLHPMIENNYKKLFDAAIPEVLKAVDDTRYYHPTSPTGRDWDESKNHGDVHYWGVWHGKEPFSKFDEKLSRFMSEYGFQSYPDENSVKKFTLPEDRFLTSEVMLSHQRCMSDERRDKEYGNRLIKNYMDEMYKAPKDFSSYLYVSQLVQAEGIKYAIEAHRRNKPYTMGTLYWQINDCWPVASWSSIDYYGSWKALHYFARDAYKQILINPLKKEEKLQINIISDEIAKRSAILNIDVMDFSGNIISALNKEINLEANKSEIYLDLDVNELLKGHKESEVLVYTKLNSNDEQIADNIFYFVHPKTLELEKPTINAELTNNKNEIRLRSNILAKNVFLHLEDFDGITTANYFDLLPGVPKLIEFRSDKELENILQRLKIKSLVDSFE